MGMVMAVNYLYSPGLVSVQVLLSSHFSGHLI